MAKKEMTYAEAMAQIEKILARFRNEEMDVDSLAAEVKRATELIAGCKSRLRKAEEEVSKILGKSSSVKPSPPTSRRSSKCIKRASATTRRPG